LRESLPFNKKPTFLETFHEKVLDSRTEKLVINFAKFEWCNEKTMEILQEIGEFDVVKEIFWLKEAAPKIGSPVVFCHGDLNPNNIVIRNDVDHDDFDGKVVLLDLDRACCNYRGADMGYFLRLIELRASRKNGEGVSSNPQVIETEIWP